MYNIVEILGQGYDENAGGTSLLCTIAVPSAADFPAQDTDYHFVIGCKGIDTSNGDKYNFDGTTWNKETGTPFSNVYTTGEIDSIISRIDTTDTTQTAALTDIINLSVKNRFPVPTRIGPSNATAAATYTQAGVQFTCNLDGTITVERISANANQAVLWLYDDTNPILVDDYTDGKFVFSNGFTGSSDTARMRLAKLYEGNYLVIDNYTTIPESAETGCNVSVIVYPSFTGSITVKPMICPKSFYDITDKWVPYTPTLQEMWSAINA